MSKLKAPLFSLIAEGHLSKALTYLRRHLSNIVVEPTTHKDVHSFAQLSWRHMYQKAVALWHALSDAEKQSWEALARPFHMTGFAYFISQALKPNPGLYLPLQGGKMAGDIDMDGYRIEDLPDPIAAQDPVTRDYFLALLNFLSLSDTPASYAGEALKGVRVNAAQDALEFSTITGGYTEGASAYHSANQAIPNVTWTVPALNSERYDTDTIHDAVVNNSRLTCKTAGKYVIIGKMRFAANAVGIRQIAIRLNGVSYIGNINVSAPSAGGGEQPVSTIWDLALTNYVEAIVYQSSGGALNLESVGGRSPEFMMQRIG